MSLNISRIALWLLLLSCASFAAPKPSAAALTPQFGRQHEPRDPMEIKREKDQQKALNKDRYDSLKKDTDKLLELSTELKKAVDDATENTLSMDVIRKTEEVEKLAKKVREKMKESFVPIGLTQSDQR